MRGRSDIDEIGYNSVPFDELRTLDGVDSADLLVTEMKLLTIEKINDFGDKIGGSAKDRYSRKKKEDTPTPVQPAKELLPAEKSLLSESDLSKYKPTVNSFIEIGMNKVCARLFYWEWYIRDTDYSASWSSLYANGFVSSIYYVAHSKEMQEVILDKYIEFKQLFKSLTAENNNEIRKPLNACLRILRIDDAHLTIEFDKISFVVAMLSQELEKGLGDDYSHEMARKGLFGYAGKILRILTSEMWSSHNSTYDNKQRLFNYFYEKASQKKKQRCNILFDKTVRGDYQVFYCAIDALKRTKRNYYSWYYSQIKFFPQELGIKCADWDEFRKNFCEWYIMACDMYDKENPELEKWEFKDKEGLFAEKRTGEDYLHGRNATTQDFMDVFGFRAVEFGETMPQKERWAHMNSTYNSFMDLSKLLGFSPKCISLGGKMAITFGSRGIGGKHAPMAHYEPQKKVINLTRRHGAGSLAHEWFHAFDHNLADWKIGEYGTKKSRVSGFEHIKNEELLEVIKDSYNYPSPGFVAFTGSGFGHASRKLDSYQRRREPYWNTSIELYARAFEYYVLHKIEENGEKNEYLAQIPGIETDRVDMYPYPHPEDKEYIMNHFDRLFKTVKETKTEEGWTLR